MTNVYFWIAVAGLFLIIMSMIARVSWQEHRMNERRCRRCMVKGKKIRRWSERELIGEPDKSGVYIVRIYLGHTCMAEGCPDKEKKVYDRCPYEKHIKISVWSLNHWRFKHLLPGDSDSVHKSVVRL